MNRTLVLSTLVLLLATGAVFADSKPFLGVMLQSIDREVAEELTYEGKGVFVQGVVEGTRKLLVPAKLMGCLFYKLLI